MNLSGLQCSLTWFLQSWQYDIKTVPAGDMPPSLLSYQNLRRQTETRLTTLRYVRLLVASLWFKFTLPFRYISSYIKLQQTNWRAAVNKSWDCLLIPHNVSINGECSRSLQRHFVKQTSATRLHGSSISRLVNAIEVEDAELAAE